MRRSPEHDLAREARERLADEVIETYVSWREACVAVRRTYAEWSGAPRGERRLAHAAHVAALDREGCAARTHGDAVERVRRETATAPS
jgi:hypothetical protein